MVFLILFLTLVHGDINLREHSHFDDSSSGIYLLCGRCISSLFFIEIYLETRHSSR